MSHVQAYIGGPAAAASKQLGAQAYTMGNKIAFQKPPSVELSAHEGTHVVQQQSGKVQLAGEMGKVGDKYEVEADAVGAKVAAGESVQPLLQKYSHRSSSSIATTGFTSFSTQLPHLDTVQQSLGQDVAKVESDPTVAIQLAKSSTRPGKVELRYYGVDLGIGHHGFIVVSDPVTVNEQGKPIKSARETLFRGGPNTDTAGSSGSTGGSISDSSGTDSSNSSETDQGHWGYIVTTSRPYVPRGLDWTTNPSGRIKTAANLDLQACDRYREKLASSMRRIEAKKVRYFPLGPNSNSVAHQGIRDAGLGEHEPPVYAPGWKTKI